MMLICRLREILYFLFLSLSLDNII
jgi:hypothetical protein